MPSRSGSHWTLVLVALAAFSAGLAGRRSEAAADSTLESRVAAIEQRLGTLTTSVERLAKGAGAPGATPGGAKAADAKLKQLESKVQQLTSRYDGHSHDYLLEGSATDGSVQAVGQEGFMASGLRSTGKVRIGKPTR